jgi:hypothetical protein
MAELILNIGPSGSGKTSGLRNLPPEKTLFVKPNPKSLLFPGSDKYVIGRNTIITDSMDMAKRALLEKKESFTYFVVDDLNHFFNARTTSAAFIAAKEGGAAFAKWNQFAADILQAFVLVANQLPINSYLFLIAHTELKDDGTVGMQSSGKLLESNLYIPGYTNFVLHSMVIGDAKDPNYVYLTNTDGIRLAKSPIGILDKSIPNDMMKVIQRIEDFKSGKIGTIKFKE